MSQTITAPAGPVDVAIIAFEGNDFNGDVAPAIRELQSDGTVRIIDLTFVRKEADGTSSIVELTDSDVYDAFEQIYQSQFDLLSDEDLLYVADSMRPSTSALVLVWENTWAARLSKAIRASHGQVVALERIPRDMVEHAFADVDTDPKRK